MACRKYLVLKITTLIGLFLKTLTTGVSWYWGNISVYTDSYYRATLGPNSGVGTPWVISTFMIGFAVGLLITQKMASIVGRTWTNIVSLILFEIGVFASYFAVNSSTSVMVVTIGAVSGVGSGITEAQLLYYVLAWSDKHVGLISALVSSSYSGGSVIINQLVTLYVNPLNESPNLNDGNKVFFIQEAILNRVPSMFLVLGTVSFCAQFIGVLMIRDNPYKETSKDIKIDSNAGTPTESSSVNRADNETVPILGVHSQETGSVPQGYSEGSTITVRRLAGLATSDPVSCELSNEHKKSKCSALENIELNGSSLGAKSEHSKPGSSCSRTETVRINLSNMVKKLTDGDGKEFSSLQLFRAPAFYALWLSTVATDYSYIIITNYYKSFGQTIIKDDHFLTNVAMIASITSALSEIFWGASLDKFKVKHCLMLYLFAQAVVGSFWYFTAVVSKYLFMLSTIILGCMNAGMYEVFFVGTLKLFGETHFSVNYGIVYTGSVLANIVAPPIIDLILDSFGWYHLFFSFSVLNSVALLVVVLALPYK